MISESYTKEEKLVIARHIKNINMEDVDEEMKKLIKIGEKANMISERSNVGNDIVDYFTFVSRLETKGKYDVNYFEFLVNLEIFREKKFIQTMLKYYEDVKNKNNTKHEYKVLKEVYNICISAINIMRPLNCMEIYTRFNAKRVLNFCAGWGGSTVAAAALNLEAFYGIEINDDLNAPYDKPVFTKTYSHLKKGGHFIINVCKEVYDNVLKKIFGDAHLSFPLKKSKRQNNHTEMVYVWLKHTT